MNPPPGDGSFRGAFRVLGVWIVISALIAAALRSRITATIEPWFVLCMFLGASAAMAPIYGGIIYAGARRRQQTRAARAAAIATISLTVLGFAFAGFMYWFVKALSGLH